MHLLFRSFFGHAPVHLSEGRCSILANLKPEVMMFQMRKDSSRDLGRITKPLLVLVALTGWGAFAYSSLSLIDIEKQLDGRNAVLQDYQVRYQQEREAAANANAEIAPLREQLAAARSEVERLSRSQNALTADLTKANSQLQAVQQQLNEQARASLVNIAPRPTERDVMAAQEALTQLHFGPIEADGVVGPDTRHAIEEFQRAAGLTVTGELHAQTLQALLRMAKVVAVQDVRGQTTVQE